MGNPDRVKSVVRPRVLVVNDDVRLGDSVRALLTAEGYDARCAVDGQAALDALARWPADLILLDLIMPHLDGWAFLLRRAADPALTDTAVVVWSVALPEELERARALGANACLPGGLTNPDRLLTIVKENVPGDRRMPPSAELPRSTPPG
jgi:CheY-like chemotaxis protein